MDWSALGKAVVALVALLTFAMIFGLTKGLIALPILLGLFIHTLYQYFKRKPEDR